MDLKNHRLQITLADPDTLQTRRFDRTAVISQVVLDGKYAFCTPEQVLPHRRTTFGMGLCGEFVAPGLAEGTAAGSWFHKPGVGMLLQPESGEAWDMWRQYETEMAPVTREQTRPDRVVFTQSGGPTRIRKALTLEGNRLVMDISVENLMGSPLHLQEYQHNFLSLDGAPVGPGYILELQCDADLSQLTHCTLRQGDEIELPSAVRVEDGRVFWHDDLEEKVMYHRSDRIDPSAPHRWILRHRDSTLSVSEEVDFLPSRVDIWAVEHCICTEFYHCVTIAPGAAACWRRTWTFGK